MDPRSHDQALYRREDAVTHIDLTGNQTEVTPDAGTSTHLRPA